MLNWFKTSSDLAHICLVSAVTGVSSAAVQKLSPETAAFTSLTSVGVMLGTQVWIVFVAGPTMRNNMTRPAFGDIQSRLFPKMGLVTMFTSGTALSGYLGSHSLDTKANLLCSSFIISILNVFILFPACSKTMFELRKHEDGTEERKRAGRIFGITHGLTSLVTLGSIGANIWFLYLIGQGIGKFW